MRRWIPLLLLLISISPAAAQQCGVAESIAYPVDTQRFRLVQDFGAPSPRHQGRYHTGEDWYAGRADNFGLGSPVHAAAAGRVTFSSPLGWGRDGGVVIIEHTFRDGNILYTQYGHMAETESIKFPAQFSCVQQGDIVGAIGNVRPAPHVHFEVRAQDGTSPGPGYSWRDPLLDGWRRPSKAVNNWQAWLHPAFSWRLDLADEAGPITPPLELDDHSLLYLDANRLGRITPDGRSLWRINLERVGVAISVFENRPLLTYADGRMQHINLDGTLAESWELNTTLARPLLLGSVMLFQAPDGALVALAGDRRGIAWQSDPLPPIRQAEQAGQVIGLMTTGDEMITLSLQGEILDRAQLRAAGSLTRTADDELRVFSVGGLWTVLADGSWSPVMENAPRGGPSAAALNSGELYLFDGTLLYAYDSNQVLRWEVQLPPGISGAVQLSDYGNVLLLTSSHGTIAALQKESGGLCGITQIFGDDRARFWHSLGEDGVLRVAVSDQIIGFNWARFLGGCA